MDKNEARRWKRKGRSTRCQGGPGPAGLRAVLVAMAFALLRSSTPAAMALAPDGTSAYCISFSQPRRCYCCPLAEC